MPARVTKKVLYARAEAAAARFVRAAVRAKGLKITRKVVDDHVETLMWNWVDNIGDLEQGADNDLD